MALLALPNELLQHIAHFLPCSSLLQLICVNRQIRTACYDQLVVKDVAQNALFNTPRAVDRLLDIYKQPGRDELKHEQLGWSEGDALLKGSSFEDRVRIAHSIEQLIRLSTLEPAAWSTAATSTMTEWLPHLLALHHPAAWCLEPDVFLLPHGQLGQSNTSLSASLLTNRWLSRTADQARDRLASARLQALHFVNFSFVLNYTTLQRLGSTTTSGDTLALFISHFDPTWAHAQSLTGTQYSVAFVIQRLSERVPGYEKFIRDFTLVQASSTLLILLLAIAFIHKDRKQRMLPVPAKIPFSNYMEIPRLYHHSAELFPTCHYKHMATPEFLSGRWMGYYSDHRIRNHMFDIDPPMQDIQMVVHGPTEEARTRLRISAVIDRGTRGYDAHGDFLLSGRVREDGLVSIAKQYLGLGTSWTWTGRITPFGIVGVWGSHLFGGYFWIFKKEWV